MGDGVEQLRDKATVIIPCFNVEDYIEECLDSVLLQGDSVLETFVVDNNSTDNTMGFIREWQDAHPSFPLIICQEKKPGAPAARNHPLNLVKTKWVQFLDADDLLMENKIKDQVEQFSEADVICAGAIHLALDGSSRKATPESNIPLGLVKGAAGITSANLFSLHYVQQNNGWDESLKSSQEYDLMFRLWKAGAKFAVDSIPRALIRERVTGQISKGNPIEKWAQLIDLQIEMISHFFPESSNHNSKEKFLQALFDRIRTLSIYDLNKASYYFNKHIKPNSFIPQSNSLNSRSYICIFRVFGFYSAERIRKWLNSKYHNVRNSR